VWTREVAMTAPTVPDSRPRITITYGERRPLAGSGMFHLVRGQGLDRLGYCQKLDPRAIRKLHVRVENAVGVIAAGLQCKADSSIG